MLLTHPLPLSSNLDSICSSALPHATGLAAATDPYYPERCLRLPPIPFPLTIVDVESALPVFLLVHLSHLLAPSKATRPSRLVQSSIRVGWMVPQDIRTTSQK